MLEELKKIKVVEKKRKMVSPSSTDIDVEGEEYPYENILANVKPDKKYQVVASTVLEKSLEKIDDQKLKERIAGARSVAEPIAGDTFYLMYSFMPLLKQEKQITNKILKHFRNVFGEWMESKEYSALRLVTQLNREASLVFSVRFARTFLAELAKLLPPEVFTSAGSGQKQGQGQKRGGGKGQHEGKHQGPQHPGGGSGGQGEKPRQQSGGRQEEEKIREAVRRAMEKAKEDAKKGLETYTNMGSLSQGFSPVELAFMDEDLGIDRVEFENIIKILGDIRKAMPLLYTRHKKRSPLGFPEGYSLTRKPERAIPRELALPDDMFMMKLLSGQFLSREKMVPAKGVMIVLLDVSGSMGGRKITWAKAVALALAVKAYKEKMDWVLVPYNAVPFPPMGIDKLRDILRLRAGGGTDIGLAITSALEWAIKNRYQRANLVVITDGVDNTVRAYVDNILELAQKAKATIRVVYIQGSNPVLRYIANKTRGELMTVKPDGKNAIRVVYAA